MVLLATNRNVAELRGSCYFHLIEIFLALILRSLRVAHKCCYAILGARTSLSSLRNLLARCLFRDRFLLALTIDAANLREADCAMQIFFCSTAIDGKGLRGCVWALKKPLTRYGPLLYAGI
jgi:hypothetical protein